MFQLFHYDFTQCKPENTTHCIIIPYKEIDPDVLMNIEKCILTHSELY